MTVLGMSYWFPPSIDACPAYLAHSTQKTVYPFLNQGFEFTQARQKTWSGLGVAPCATIQALFKSGRFSRKCGMSKRIAGQTWLRRLIHRGYGSGLITSRFMPECSQSPAGSSPVGSDVPIVSPSGKPARLPHDAACARRATTSSSIFFDELAEPHDGAKRETQVFWRNKLGSRRVGLNLTTPEADRA